MRSLLVLLIVVTAGCSGASPLPSGDTAPTWSPGSPTPVPRSAPFAIWPEDTEAAAHEVDLSEDAWRAHPAEVARLFGAEVLGWDAATATRYRGPVACSRCYVVRRDRGGRGVRIGLVEASGTGAWFVRSVGAATDDPEHLSVTVRGGRVAVAFARRGARIVEVRVGYAGRDRSTEVGQGGRATLELGAEPTTSGHLLLLFRDGDGRVFLAEGLALPSGDFEAG